MHVEITTSGAGGSVTLSRAAACAAVLLGVSDAAGACADLRSVSCRVGEGGSWAAGRHEEIVTAVANEVVRQKASGRGFCIDPDTGIIEIADVRPRIERPFSVYSGVGPSTKRRENFRGIRWSG